MEAIGNIMNKGVEEKQTGRINDPYLLSFKDTTGKLSYEKFQAGICHYAKQVMLKKSLTHPYDIDSYNEPVIRQLYLYFTNDRRCEWNLNAGIMFGGKLGCGKSLLMEAYLLLTDRLTRKITNVIHSSGIGEWIKVDLRRPENFCWRAPLFIDELGREATEIKDYGNVRRPMISLFELRYLHGGRTYATTNFKWNTLQETYGGGDPIKGEYIVKRMQEMMTLVPVPGESRRLKNEIKK